MVARGFLGWEGGREFKLGSDFIFFLLTKFNQIMTSTIEKEYFFTNSFFITPRFRKFFWGKTFITFQPGFFLLNFLWPILRCSHTGHHSQEDLAKFDYRSIQKETKSYYSLATFCKLLPKVGNSKKKNSSITTLEQFFHKNPLYDVH